MNTTFLIEFVRDVYKSNDLIPLHVPSFKGNERRYLNEVVDSTFVSSVGKFVDEFEYAITAFTGTEKAVATVNGTAALHAALHAAGVSQGDLVITQSLTFVATCNALHHMGAKPVFTDVSDVGLGLCPVALSDYLEQNAEWIGESCMHKGTGQVIRAVVPMHTFGHPAQLDELLEVCSRWGLILVEDAAESLGSFYKGRHTGTVGDYGALSFNGNKIITTGGGGMVLCKEASSGAWLKHLTTTAKVPHPYEFFHDVAGFNYRMPNLNAALGCAQMESLHDYLQSKRDLALSYKNLFYGSEYEFVLEPDYARSNYWLNAIVCPDKSSRDQLLEQTNQNGVMTRPIWTLMHKLPMYSNCLRGDLPRSEFYEERIVNLPSSPPMDAISGGLD